MKKKIIIATAAASMIATPAFAGPTDESDVIVNASVAKECSIEDIGTIAIGDISINEAPGVDALQIVGETRQDSGRFWVSCNFTNSMTLSTPTPLVSASATALLPTVEVGSQAFTDTIQYRLRAQNYKTSPYARSNGSGDGVTSTRSTGPIHEGISFRASVWGEDNVGQRPIAATDYTATATVSMSAL